MIKIYNLKKEIQNNDTILSAKIDSELNIPGRLWFSVPNNYGEYLVNEQYDAFLVGILFIAIKNNEEIFIDGSISEKLFFNINNYVIPLINSYIETNNNIKVQITKSNSKKLMESYGVGTGFSGGIDSFSTIFERYEKEEIKNNKINTLVMLNVGSHGNKNSEAVEKKFKERFNYLKSFPDEIEVPFIPVNSNLSDFYDQHQQTHTLTLVSGILSIQKGLNKYYVSSAGLDYGNYFKFSDSYQTIDIGAYSDPVLLPLLSTETLNFISDGHQYTRAEKTAILSDYEPTKNFLNVCVSGDDTYENCSECSKCSRTLMTLDSLNKLEDYDNIFDIEKYKSKISKKYEARQVLTQDKDFFAKDNVQLAEKHGKKLPSKVGALVILLPNIIRTHIGKIVRSIF